MNELKPGQTVLVYAEVRKVEPGTEGALPVVQLSLTPAEGFSQQRDVTVVVPLAKVHSIVGEQEAVEHGSYPLSTSQDRSREQVVSGTIASGRKAPNAGSEFMPGQTMSRIDKIQASELAPAEAVEASQYVRSMPGCRADYGNDEAAIDASVLMSGGTVDTTEAKYLRGWLREQGKVETF